MVFLPPSARLAPRRGNGSGRSWARRVGTIGAVAAALLGLGAGVAAAHVTVNPPTAAAGSYAKLTFRVPTESATASTVGLTVSLPTDHPFPSVSVMPVPGWTATTHTVPLDPPVAEGRFELTEATDSVTWTADDGNGVKPGEFMEFSLSVGPVPGVETMTFPAKQTYSDGSIVSWDRVATGNGSPAPDHPAPRLTITPAAAATGAAASTGGSAATAQILAAVALVIAAAALLFSVLAWRRGPRGRRSASEEVR